MVTLYRGGAYHLYRYKIWTDVRLVFAPEAKAAQFGGDTDNFVYPRFDLDVSFLRVYENGARDQDRAHILKWANKRGIEDGELVFAAGHPGSTDRRDTVAQVVFDRDVRYPLMIATATRQRKMLQEYSRRVAGIEAPRRAQPGRHRELAQVDQPASTRRCAPPSC